MKSLVTTTAIAFTLIGATMLSTPASAIGLGVGSTSQTGVSVGSGATAGTNTRTGIGADTATGVNVNTGVHSDANGSLPRDHHSTGHTDMNTDIDASVKNSSSAEGVTNTTGTVLKRTITPVRNSVTDTVRHPNGSVSTETHTIGRVNAD